MLEWILTSFSLAELTKGIGKTGQLKILNYIPFTLTFYGTQLLIGKPNFKWFKVRSNAGFL
jgi:hypothetical protein